jgi:hypothetical protein
MFPSGLVSSFLFQWLCILPIIWGTCFLLPEFLATDPEVRVRLPILSLVSTTEVLVERKSSGSCLENRDYGVGYAPL